MIRIIVDTMGGDKSPDVNLQGGLDALNKYNDLHITFIGNEEVIKEKLKGKNFDSDRIDIINASETIDCNDIPTVAIKTKTDSSMIKAFERLRSGSEEAFVTNGSTGAIIAGTVLKLGRINGVKRPALCPVLPTMNGGIVAICDSGANVDCDSTMLYQFALMTSLYMEKAYGIQRPKLALLNVGTEEEKGDALRKDTFKLLSENKDLNFVGNMESRDLLSGSYDIVICDGFSGNVLCKSTEGACLEMSKLVGKLFMKNPQAAQFVKEDLKALGSMMDYNNYGGAILLGASKTIIKAHGSCGATAILHCIEQAYNSVKNDLTEDIENIIRQTQINA